jgi:transcriptional regulator with XRE-family HTH domain
MAKSFDELVARTTTKETRERAARRTQELLGELLIREIREQSGKSQADIASALGIKQPSVSKMEKQSDMQISTLRRIVEAMGGELELVVRLPEGTFSVKQFDNSAAGTRRTPRSAKRQGNTKVRRKRPVRS